MKTEHPFLEKVGEMPFMGYCDELVGRLGGCRQERGSALIMAMLILLVLTVIGITGANQSILQERMAANHSSQTKALFDAETKIQEISESIQELGAGPANFFLKNACYYVTEGEYHDSLEDVLDVLDEDGQQYLMTVLAFADLSEEQCEGALDDANDGVTLREMVAVAVGEYHGSERTIRASFNLDVEAESVVGDAAESAFMCYGADATGNACELSTTGTARVDGMDFNVPDDFECSGNACKNADQGTDEDGNPLPTRPGALFVEDEDAVPVHGGAPQGGTFGEPNWVNPVLDGGGEPTGDYIGSDGSFYGRQTDSGSDFWIDLVSDLESDPGNTVNEIDFSVENAGDAGTRSDPALTIMREGSSWEGNTSGAGILVVEPNVDFAGTMSFEGLVIMMPGATFSAGNATIYGAVVAVDGGSFEATGNYDLRYSSMALANVDSTFFGDEDALGEVRAWQQLVD